MTYDSRLNTNNQQTFSKNLFGIGTLATDLYLEDEDVQEVSKMNDLKNGECNEKSKSEKSDIKDSAIKLEESEEDIKFRIESLDKEFHFPYVRGG